MPLDIPVERRILEHAIQPNRVMRLLRLGTLRVEAERAIGVEEHRPFGYQGHREARDDGIELIAESRGWLAQQKLPLFVGGVTSHHVSMDLNVFPKRLGEFRPHH